jgi:hypothetical protein
MHSTLEKAFDSIRIGNEYESVNDFWKAAHFFEDAQRLLHSLSLQNPPADSTEENDKIASLLKEQSMEYLTRARNCFINALKNECKLGACSSVDSSSQALHLESGILLSDEECIERISLFGMLFAKALSDIPIIQGCSNQNDIKIEEQESSLEDRLLQLNKSLPPSCKSEEERLRQLNRSLGRIGLSLYSDTKPLSGAFAIDAPKSEFDQIEDVIAQAKDEATLIGSFTETGNTTETGQSSRADDIPKNNLLCVDDVSDTESPSDVDDESSGNEEKADLTPEICRELHDSVAEVQVSLAELNAFLEVDKDGYATIQFDQASGKRILKQSMSLLFQVKKKWDEHEK